MLSRQLAAQTTGNILEKEKRKKKEKTPPKALIRSTERQLDTLDTNTLKELSVSITVATDGSVTHFSVNQHVSGFKGAKGTECTGSGGFKGEETRLTTRPTPADG